MRWSYNLERSYLVGIWLFSIAVLVALMVLLGGITRLTGSGLSITEWQPIVGIIPPLNTQAWETAFRKYQAIPQYRELNAHISLERFKTLYGWEWGHRLFGRLIGLSFALPFFGFLVTKKLPARLFLGCFLLLVLVGLEGFLGWWMVKSGLSQGVFVAPQRLAIHLITALMIFSICIFTGLEAWFGRHRGYESSDGRWRLAAFGLVALVLLQCCLGALTAGNHAGRVYNDWPLMNGKLFPSDYILPHKTLGFSLWHSQAAVQFNHRLGAYALVIATAIFSFRIGRERNLSQTIHWTGYSLFAIVILQAFIGILGLYYHMPLNLALLHQALALVSLLMAIILAWQLSRH